MALSPTRLAILRSPTWAEHCAEMREREAAEVARYARLRQLAEQNGDRAPLVEIDFMPGMWWRVPPHFVPITGCQMARVA